MDKNINLTEAEEKLAALIWREAPLTSPELVALADKEMDWKKSTTYTVLKKLCDKGVFKNENTNVTVILSREELIVHQSRCYVEDKFDGSLPKFIISFTGGKNLTPEQDTELRRLIEDQKEGFREYKLKIRGVTFYLRSFELLERFKRKEFGLEAAYHISFISELGQRDLNIVLRNPKYRLDTKKAKLMREKYQRGLGIFTCDDAEKILKGENTTKTPFKLNPEFMAKYYPNGYTGSEVEAEIAVALEFYRKHK